VNPVIDIEHLLEIVKEVERETPIDWGMLPFDEEEAVKLIAYGIVEQFENEWVEKFSLQEMHYIMLATIIKLVAENFVLNATLYKRKDS
jgi:hypothetical protein